MPLSEHEQQMLNEIERALYAEDPKFASNVRGIRLRRPPRRRRLQGISLLLVGIAILVTGMLIPVRPFGIPVVSFLGFVLMFFGALMALTSLRQPAAAEGSGSDSGEGSAPRRSSFTRRMEDRLRKRFEQG